MERAIHIEKRDIADLGDLLNVARSIGKKLFNVERVRVFPEIAILNNGYVVIVSPLEKNGKEKPDVEKRQSEK